jgi:transcriptional regulator with XRE-family HTH domain
MTAEAPLLVVTLAGFPGSGLRGATCRDYRPRDGRSHQAELARRLGVTQAAISRIEQPHDLLLSTLNSYLGAIGGRASVIVTFADGHETTLDLSQLR